MANYQTVVVSGANRGLGLEFTRQLADQAEQVVATCRDPAGGTALSELAADRDNVNVVGLDVTEPAQIARLVEALQGSPVDLLINNAGVGNWQGYPLDTLAWEEVLRVNSIAPIKVSEALVDLVAASSRKIIANITSKMGSIADNSSGGAIIYRTSKAALNAATRSFALDHAERGVTTLLLHPGWVRTDMGGPNGLIDAPESVSGMCRLIGAAGADQNGRFFDYSGQEIPW